jgi:hypothetical protein
MAKSTKRSNAGRPAKTLDEKDLEEVRKLAGFGLTGRQIALVKKMDEKTLMKYAASEMEKGRAEAHTFVVNQLFRNIKDGKEASIFFYLKTQCGWTETQRIETDINVQHVISAKPIDDNEWAKKWTGKTIDITKEEDDEQED